MFQKLKQVNQTARAGVSAMAIVVAFVLGGPSVQAEPEVLDGVAVIVNDSVVMVSEIEERYQIVLSGLAENQAAQLPPKDEIVETIIEQLISESIQLQEANFRGISVSDEDVTNIVREVAQREYGKTIEEFRELLTEQGVSYNQFRNQVYREQVIQKVRQILVGPRVYISQQDVKEFRQLPYFDILAQDRFRVGHILISPDDTTSTSASALLKEANEIVTELREGADFAIMAVNHSSASTALEGGDLGWRYLADLPQLFVEQVQEMEIGDISDPIRNERGLHIIKLLDKRGASNTKQEQTWVRHILVQSNAIKSELEAKSEIEAIRARIENGEDFAELAEEYSDDSISAREGGDLGWITDQRLDPIFTEVMNSTEPGELSAVFASGEGWHILEVLERKVADVTEQALDNFAISALYNRLFEEALQDWLQEIRGEAFVKVIRDSF